MAETKTPTLHWAQREQKVLIEFQMLNTKDAKVTLSEGLLSLECAVDATAYKLENLPLFAEIDEEESKWFRDDRKIAISLKKKAPEWWDTLSKDKSFKKFIKTDFSKWCEDDDKEYTGDLGPEGDGMPRAPKAPFFFVATVGWWAPCGLRPDNKIKATPPHVKEKTSDSFM